ncbi:hypothetical protein VNO77_27479 [Canavalia gladiata]|uniref:SHSP domain-containing protein n=1 Tax=Canavalia gladiata TaxID=3824 RepID=A0AAN9Q473_CANGL
MKRQAVGFKREGHVVAQVLRQRSFLVQRRCMRDDTDAAGANVAPSRDKTPTSSNSILWGFTKEDVNLKVKENNLLCITAEKREEEDKSLKQHRRERKINGVFSREFMLLENVKVDNIKASMHGGMLNITMPKDEIKK